MKEGTEAPETAPEERYSAFVGALMTPDQRDWIRRAAANRQTSQGAIVRAAVEAYRRLHPTLG